MCANCAKDDLPEDLIPAYKARRLLACSGTTLRRFACEGRLRQWRHPERTGYFYCRAEVEQMRGGFRRVNGNGDHSPGGETP